ncbi:MAG: MFS transporter [Pseudomonadota bacterium]
MRILLSFAALFLSIVFVQLSSGAMGPLDVLSGVALGFSTAEIGRLGSAHFVGFFIGCWWAPRIMGSVGHGRTFAVFAAFGTLGALGHTLTTDPNVWAVLRVLTGMAVAGSYTVVESWLQAKVTNATRGRALGAYRLVDITASLAGQLMIGFLTPAAYVSYTILAIFCCLSLLPLTLSTAQAPKTPAAPRLRPGRALALSPLAAAAVMVSGLTMASFRMVGPLYAVGEGRGTVEVGYFLAAGLLGGALAQVPIGWLADKIDRRRVLLIQSLAAIAVAMGLYSGGLPGDVGFYGGALLFGFAAFPLFSVAAAHANDHAEADEVVELNAALIFLYACGAVLAPVVAAALVEGFGPRALFGFISAAHVLLVLFALSRMRARPSPERRTPYTYLPRTSLILRRLFKRRG